MTACFYDDENDPIGCRKFMLQEKEDSGGIDFLNRESGN